jgi:cell division protein FtsQ
MTQVIETTEREPVAIDPRILERREEVARQRTRSRLQVAGAVGAVVVMLGLSWAVLHSPLLAARHVTVVGAGSSTGAVMAAAGLDGQPPLIDVNPGQVAAHVEALPWVAHASVARQWPDTVTVTVVERVPVAAVDRPGHGAVLVDRGGHVLASVAVVPPGTVVLSAPVAVGPPGSVLGAGAAPALAVVRAVPPALERRLESVAVAADGDVTLALTGNVGVTLGPAVELRAKFQALYTVLVDVPPPSPEVIDVTVPGAPAVGPPPVPAPAAGHTPAPPPPAPGAENARARWVPRPRRVPS